MDLGLRDSVVLVTGGGRGVGLGITKAFQAEGAKVVICARHEPETDIGAEFIQCDVRDTEQVDALIDEIAARHGRLDVVVNNAGGSPPVDAATVSPRFHAGIVGLNLLAPLLVSQRANAVMQKQESGGSIIMISSICGSRPSPTTAAYAAAKAGLNNLAGSLAVEWAPKVRVNSLGVGMVLTDRVGIHNPHLDEVAKTVPLGRLAQPEEIGSCAVFLASPMASYVSGSTLIVHGGGEVPAYLNAGREDG
ncbi:SDR family oxidoreductase [Actinocrispum sp. NPDC049592]|uniref:SDR family oxidoreductase n=1 Tax=Actinocrispum sp. NPDC049592 TaxID=3154835 RepID=UPI00343E73CF